MLAPDVGSTQSQLQNHVNAAVLVTGYCQAVVTLLPPFTQPLNQPQVQQDIATLEKHAKLWLSGLCQRFAAGVPQMFVDFGSTFDTAAPGLTAAANTLQSNPQDASALATLTSGLSALAGDLQTLGKTAAALQADVKAFLLTVNSDNKMIQGDLTSIAQSVPGGDTIVHQLNGALTAGFFSSQEMSPCLAIIELQENISFQLTELGTNAPQLVPLALGKAVLSGLSTNNAQAGEALAAILDTLATLLAKYQAVLSSIQQANAASLPPILQELDIQNAATAWQQLAQFASSLITP